MDAAQSGNTGSENIVARLLDVAHSIETNTPGLYSWEETCRDAATEIKKLRAQLRQTQQRVS